MFDLLLASSLNYFISPMLYVAIAIKLSSDGPVFFVQIELVKVIIFLKC